MICRFFIFACFLLGCSDNVMMHIEKRAPDILVHPANLDFGNLKSGEESGIETFSVINVGDEILTIESPILVSSDNRFDLHSSSLFYEINPGELLDFEVKYTPETYETNTGVIEIISDDEDEPIVNVTIAGYGDAPVMTVTPENCDYGNISIGCDNEERITIRNDGNTDLLISSVVQMVTLPTDIIMEYGSLPDPPWTLVPGQEIDFLVSYTPSDIGHDESLVTITSNDPVSQSASIVQHGSGDIEQWYQHQWVQEAVPVLDVLWVIDNSGSMNPFQQSLATNIGSFMTAFLSGTPDYRMAVITTDRYDFSVILDNMTTNAEQELSSLVVTGVMGSGMEKGLLMAKSSLSNSSYAGLGGSFFRQDATLVVVFVSDEPDYSGDWASFIPFFDSVKTPGLFIPYAVIGDVPGGCMFSYGGYNRNAQAGDGYWDIVDYYGGKWYSICALDWGVQLQDLAYTVTKRRIFNLEESDPIENTIDVYVNGQQVVEWVYDASINSVVFNEGHIPEENQTIIIDYAVWGCGET